jgi:hypothetical protein
VGEVDGGASLLRQPIPALWQLTAIVLSMARLVGVRHRRHFRRRFFRLKGGCSPFPAGR